MSSSPAAKTWHIRASLMLLAVLIAAARQKLSPLATTAFGLAIAFGHFVFKAGHAHRLAAPRPRWSSCPVAARSRHWRTRHEPAPGQWLRTPAGKWRAPADLNCRSPD
jgi:hypothetical protein